MKIGCLVTKFYDFIDESVCTFFLHQYILVTAVIGKKNGGMRLVGWMVVSIGDDPGMVVQAHIFLNIKVFKVLVFDDSWLVDMVNGGQIILKMSFSEIFTEIRLTQTNSPLKSS